MVTVFYVDTSALVTAYLRDEPEHDKFRKLLLEGDAPILSSDFTRIEFAGAMTAAKRTGRIPDPAAVLAHFDHLASPDGDLVLIPFSPDRVIPAARRLVTENYPVRTLDAIHIAVAMHSTAELTGGESVTFVTRDERQAEAAEANGFEVL
ncbi:type II toxin-antitoxin system VapC family toxin [Amycolatopsis sp. NPDC051128]|uniref:type II toxin-antitoxin system VapC family toxin n=1 Tax=Amycolatopsis sp. NPDC051128 TaxID=3155412 RepID=UPI0034212338